MDDKQSSLYAMHSVLFGGLNDIEKILYKLKFIGSIEKDQKVNTAGLYVQPNTYLTAASRSLTGESRETTLIFIKDVISSAFDVVFSYSNSEKKFERDLCFCLIDDLVQAKVGLENLKSTYESDVMYKSKIETIFSLVEAKISELSHKSHISSYLNKQAAVLRKKRELEAKELDSKALEETAKEKCKSSYESKDEVNDEPTE